MKFRAFMFPLAAAVAFLLAAAFTAVSFSKDAKTFGQVSDPDVLARVKTYCVDMSQGTPADIAEEKKFVDEESNSKKSLGRLSWTRTDDCKQADAVMNFKFAMTQKVAQAVNSVSVATEGNVPVDAFVATLNVTDRASGKALYQVNGEATETARYRSMVNAVQKLTRDLKKLSG